MGLVYVAKAPIRIEGFRFSFVPLAVEMPRDRVRVTSQIMWFVHSFDVMKLAPRPRGDYSIEADDRTELAKVRINISSAIYDAKKESELLYALSTIATHARGYGLRHEQQDVFETALQYIAALLQTISDETAIEVLERIGATPASTGLMAFFAINGTVKLRTRLLDSLKKFSPRNAVILFEIGSGLRSAIENGNSELESDYARVLYFRVIDGRFGTSLDLLRV